ncbi:LysM peptidoglycan-binding domain-containing protein [Lutibacter sp.]
MKKKLLYIIFLVLTQVGFSQSKTDTIKPQKLEDTKELFSETDTVLFKVVDSLTFKIYKKAKQIDSLWLAELVKSPLYDTIPYVLEDDEVLVTDLEELPTSLLKERLKILDSKTPFHIEYNPHLEQIIKTYLKRRKSAFSNLMERARYFFPMFEEQLDKYNIPLEIKYLAIVESALKPRARSRVGATGLWQFMYQTGKQFNLNVSSYVDERSDPYRSTEAACKYLSNLYKIFGDWDLALAAYNSGPGNVTKAIRRSGGSTNYWNIRHYLPRETAGYVPSFYATLYIFEYANEHKIKAKKSALPYFKTDTVQIKRQLTFEQINKTLNVDIALLQFLNPQYKLDIIPYVKGKNYTLTLPIEAIGTFLSNEKNIYAYVDKQEAKREKPLPKYFEMNSRIRYKVRRGDYLGKIAYKFGVTVSKIKRWNNLKSNNLRIGQRLTIYPRRLNVSVSTKKTKKKSTKKKPKGKYRIYTVKSGDSLWAIAQKFSNVSVQNIKDWNGIWNVKDLKPGIKLKIYY